MRQNGASQLQLALLVRVSRFSLGPSGPLLLWTCPWGQGSGMQSRVEACLSQVRRDRSLSPQLSMKPPFSSWPCFYKANGSVCRRGRHFCEQPSQCQHSSRPQRTSVQCAPRRKESHPRKHAILLSTALGTEGGRRLPHQWGTSGFTQMLSIPSSPQVFHKLF